MKLSRLYSLLYELYGPQGWWPVDTQYHLQMGTDSREEIIIGAILTQNTSWKNVQKALENLKNHGELSLSFIRKADTERLKELIRPAGFYNQKAIKLKSVAEFFEPVEIVHNVSREELLKVKGVGKETADVILLYAGERLTFVIDKYTQRFVERFLGVKGDYDELKAFFEKNIDPDLTTYKEFHALIDEHAKRYCKSTPLCEGCPLRAYCLSAAPSF